MRGPRADLVIIDEAAEFVSRCPVCADPIDYCQGHGEIGDPDGFWILQEHDKGEHQYCDKQGCDDAGTVTA